MRKWRSFFGFVLAVAAPAAGADAGAAPPPVPPCVKVQTQAIFSGAGYNHVVGIENGCARAADCEVSTDVAPEKLAVTVPPGESRELVTFRGSPASEFKAVVKCALKK
jgi:hypothetical protein